MTTNTKVFIGIIIALLAGFGFVSIKGTSPIIPAVGALTGPDNYLPYFGVNGVNKFMSRLPMRTATTTLCSFKSPTATSTLKGFTLTVNTGTSTAATIDIGSATTAYATTTNLYVGSYSIASGAQGSVAVIPTTATTTIFSPSTYINAKTNGAGLGGYTYGGYCTAEFQTL